MTNNVHNCVDALKAVKRIIIENHYGSWSVIDDFKGYVLLEHNTYGDETNYFIAKANKFTYKNYKNKEGVVMMLPTFNESDVYETYDDIETALNDYELI